MAKPLVVIVLDSMAPQHNGIIEDTVEAVEITFFGVRGSCPCAGEGYRRYGGNTSCVLVDIEGDAPLILDLGTGLRALGDMLEKTLRAEGRPLEATALLTHLHFDHILGLPFFGPLHDPGASLLVYGPRQEGSSLKETLHAAVAPPFFPVHMTDFRGEVSFNDIADDEFAIGSAKIRSRTIDHRGHTLGFRVEADGHSVVYMPDHQAPLDRRSISEGVLELCDGADLLLHDAQYTDEEFVDKSEWGHSTVPYAVRVAAESGVKRLILFHHDPSHTDRDIDRLVTRARRLPDAKRLEDISAAHEGSVIKLGRS
jgi:ribonuclease BN (tRNA processing enzyme)